MGLRKFGGIGSLRKIPSSHNLQVEKCWSLKARNLSFLRCCFCVIFTQPRCFEPLKYSMSVNLIGTEEDSERTRETELEGERARKKEEREIGATIYIFTEYASEKMHF